MNQDNGFYEVLKANRDITVTRVSENSFIVITSSLTPTLSTRTEVLLPPGYSFDNEFIDKDVTPSKEDQKSDNYYLRKGRVINKPTGLLAKLIRKV
jgi:hypothetical protein